MTAYQSPSRDDQFRDIEAYRQETIDRLTAAFASDAISMEEYERRASAANEATRVDQLELLSFDLPAVRKETGKPRPRTEARPDFRRETRNAIDPSLVGAAPITTGCVMGDRRLTGNWLSSDRVSAFTVMGATLLDLRDVDLPPGPVRIEAFTLMGETKIIVPRDLPVRVNAFALMGESRAGREVNQQVNGASSWVEVSGVAMMGSIYVKAMD